MTALKIVMASSEVAPLAKTGGLADVTPALAKALVERGHEVLLFMPLYRRLREQGRRFETVPGLERVQTRLGPHHYVFAVRKTRLQDGLEVWCVDCPQLYDRAGIYTSDPDEPRRFALLSRALLTSCQALSFAPDVVHAHDWHAALLPLYVRMLSSWDRLFQGTKTVLTIHNLGYQGSFPASVVSDLGLEDARHLLHQDHLAAGRVSFLVTGLLYAHKLTTVSRTYAREIQTEAHGWGLDGILRARSQDLVGIVNGVDYSIWSPERDARIPRRFSAEDLSGKVECKRALQASLGLPVSLRAPVFGVVSRLTYQKGLELLFDPLPELLARHEVRVAVLGGGEERYERFFQDLQRRFPRKVCYYRGYHDDLAHRIEAGADLFLMPSRFEPCGLNQMYSLRYGTIPIVRNTGGLADTVRTFDPKSGEGTGIVFDHFDADAMRWALRYALELYYQPRLWERLVQNAMAEDFSWERQSGHYERLYEDLLALPRRGH